MVKDAIRTSLSNVNKGVCYDGVALPFTFNSIGRQKRRIMETPIFQHAKILSSNKSSKRN